MEIFSIIITTMIFAVTSHSWNKKDSVIGKIIDAALGGTIEALLENLAEKFAPKLLKHNSLRTNKERLIQEISDYVNGIPSQKKEELTKYISESFLRKDNDDKYKNLFEEIVNKSENPKKELKTLIKTFTKTQEADIHFHTPEMIALEIFGCEGKNAPTEIIDIICIVNRHVFELKYLEHANEERDVVKTIQFMIEDSPLLGDIKKMIKNMQSHFDVIAQQNVYPGFSVKKIDSLAASDPFFFVRLQCPECGASGNLIKREDDRAICLSCDEVFDIIRNDATLVKIIETAEASITNQLKETGMTITEKLEKEIKAFASKTVSAEYFRQSQQEAQKREQENVVRITNRIDLIEKKVEEKINKSAREFSEALSRLQNDERARIQHLSRAIKLETDKLSAAASANYISLMTLGKEINEQTTETLNLARKIELMLRDGDAMNSSQLKDIFLYLETMKKTLDTKEIKDAVSRSLANKERQRLDETLREIREKLESIENRNRRTESTEVIPTAFECPHCRRGKPTLKLFNSATREYRCDCGYKTNGAETSVTNTGEPEFSIYRNRYGELIFHPNPSFSMNEQKLRTERLKTIKELLKNNVAPRILIEESALTSINRGVEGIALSVTYEMELERLLDRCKKAILLIDQSSICAHSLSEHAIAQIGAALPCLEKIFLSGSVRYVKANTYHSAWNYSSNEKVLTNKSK